MRTGRNTATLVAITGGIGSGKSRVSRFWAEYMALPRIDIDEVCRELLLNGNPGWRALHKVLPPDFFTARGELDRRLLRAALFADENLRREVNTLIHPLARQRLELLAGRAKAAMVLVDVPLLYEAGWQERFDHCVVVYADPVTCCQRLIARDQVGPDEAARAMAAQMPLPEKALLAQHVIDNSGCWLSARLQVVHLARLLYATYLRESETTQENP